MFSFAKKFLSPVKNSVKGDIQPNEVARASILSAISASSIWVFISILWSIVQTVITDPNFNDNLQSLWKLVQEKNYIAIVVAVGTFILDLLRRKYLHGK